MNTQEIKELLEEKGFNGKEKDSGLHFSKTMEPVKLICFIEPDVEVQFVTQYRWKNNDVKGTYNISVRELSYAQGSVADLFRMTLDSLPQKIGLCVDAHAEVNQVIDYIFNDGKEPELTVADSKSCPVIDE